MKIITIYYVVSNEDDFIADSTILYKVLNYAEYNVLWDANTQFYTVVLTNEARYFLKFICFYDTYYFKPPVRFQS